MPLPANGAAASVWSIQIDGAAAGADPYRRAASVFDFVDLAVTVVNPIHSIVGFEFDPSLSRCGDGEGKQRSASQSRENFHWFVYYE